MQVVMVSNKTKKKKSQKVQKEVFILQILRDISLTLHTLYLHMLCANLGEALLNHN